MKAAVNHNFFSDIITEEQAYWLGFWAADGCIHYNGKIHSLSLSLSKKDSDHLKKIHALLCPSHAFREEATKYNKDGSIKSNPMVAIKVSSSKMFHDLVNLGFGLRKTYSGLSIPLIPQELIHHFIRGYFDGDGCISESRGVRTNGYDYHNANFTIVAHHRQILDEIKSFFEIENIAVTVKHYSRKFRNDRESSFYVLTISGLKNTSRVYGVLYKDSSISLDRKKNIFQRIVRSQQLS